jgi:hypothetical protein
MLPPPPQLAAASYLASSGIIWRFLVWHHPASCFLSTIPVYHHPGNSSADTDIFPRHTRAIIEYSCIKAIRSRIQNSKTKHLLLPSQRCFTLTILSLTRQNRLNKRSQLLMIWTSKQHQLPSMRQRRLWSSTIRQQSLQDQRRSSSKLRLMSSVRLFMVLFVRLASISCIG